MAKIQTPTPTDKINNYLVWLITRFRFHTATGDQPREPFIKVLQDTAKSVSTAAGIRKLLQESKKIYKEYFGEYKPVDKGILSKQASSAARINGVLSKNLLRCQIRLLEIKLEAAPSEPILLDETQIKEDLAAELNAAIARTRSNTRSNTVIRYSALELCDMDMRLLQKSLQSKAMGSIIQVSLEQPWIQDMRDYKVYYSKNVTLIECTYPVIKVTCTQD